MMHNQTANFRKSAAQGPKPPTLSYAMAVLSVAVAIIAAELITRLLHAEPIASSMLCAVIFAAWFGGFGPALLAITLTLLAFHYYLVPQSIHLPGSIIYSLLIFRRCRV
jgi:K+-sensing histidine kinase KdpD